MIAIGIDNGVSGSIGTIFEDSVEYVPMPVNRCLNYTKSKQFLNRVDGVKLWDILFHGTSNLFCMIERPMINPTRWKASMSAIRALEATLIILEALKVPYQFVDSKEWQRELLPKGLKKEELKIASLEVGKRLFPQVNFKGFKDADGLLISEFCRRDKKNHGR